MLDSLHCFFCGNKLTAVPAPTGRYSCGKCRARFRAESDPEGCVVRLEVAECGAEECCRRRK